MCQIHKYWCKKCGSNYKNEDVLCENEEDGCTDEKERKPAHVMGTCDECLGLTP